MDMPSIITQAKQFSESVWNNPRTVIGFLVVLGCFGFLFVLTFHTTPPANKDILQLAAGSVLTTLATVVGFYFGSSKSAADQQKTLLDNVSKMPPSVPAA